MTVTVVLLRTSPTEKKDYPAIYFAANEGGIKAYSVLTSEVKAVVRSNESCYGIAFDSFHNKIYWSTYMGHKIYRANVDGSQGETVLSMDEGKYFSPVIHILAYFI